MANEMIEVTQRGCEWMALVEMAKVLSLSPRHTYHVLNKNEKKTARNALDKVACGMPDAMRCTDSASVLFEAHEVSVLVRIVEWFDALLLANADELESYGSYLFAKKYQQVGLVNRNLKMYAKTYPNPEIKTRRDDDTH